MYSNAVFVARINDDNEGPVDNEAISVCFNSIPTILFHNFENTHNNRHTHKQTYRKFQLDDVPFTAYLTHFETKPDTAVVLFHTWAGHSRLL